MNGEPCELPLNDGPFDVDLTGGTAGGVIVEPNSSAMTYSAARSAALPDGADATPWLAAGVSIVNGPAAPDRPAVSIVTTTPYELLPSIPVPRPAAERAAVVLVALLATAAAVVAFTKRRTAVAVILPVMAAVGLVTWHLNRPAVAVRSATLPAAPGHVDDWFLLTAPDARGNESATVALVGLTLPVAYSADHLRRMSPVLRLDAAGRPVTLTVDVPAGSAALVLRRRAGTESDAAPWSAALQRRLYPDTPQPRPEYE